MPFPSIPRKWMPDHEMSRREWGTHALAVAWSTASVKLLTEPPANTTAGRPSTLEAFSIQGSRPCRLARRERAASPAAKKKRGASGRMRRLATGVENARCCAMRYWHAASLS